MRYVLSDSQRNAEGGIDRFHFIIRETADEVGQHGFGDASQIIAVDGAVMFKPFIRADFNLSTQTAVLGINRGASRTGLLPLPFKMLFHSIAQELKIIFRLFVKPFGVALEKLNFLRLGQFSLGRWSKGKDNRPRRNFTGHVNSQPMAGRYFYGLRYCHW